MFHFLVTVAVDLESAIASPLGSVDMTAISYRFSDNGEVGDGLCIRIHCGIHASLSLPEP